MRVSVRSYLAAGAAFAGAASLVVTPVEGSGVPERAGGIAYSLAATSTAISDGASSAANVPANLVNLVLSVPAWEVEAMGRLADAMIATGSWQVWGPTNVFGFDEEDPPKLAAIIDMLIPIQPISSVLGAQLNWWAQANLPMNAGCAAAQGACPDPKAMLDSVFRVPASELFGGYQFPVVTNPFTGLETSWSRQYVKPDRNGVSNSLREYLTAPPVGVKTVSAAEAFSAMSRLAKSFNDAFYPFVQNSQWFDNKQTVFAPLFRALAPVLCASCDPANPYDNPWLKNYPQQPASGAARPASLPPAAATEVAANTTTATPRPEGSQTPDGQPAALAVAPEGTVAPEPAGKSGVSGDHRQADAGEHPNSVAALHDEAQVSTPQAGRESRVSKSTRPRSRAGKPSGRSR